MSKENPTFEEVDAHVEKSSADIKALQAAKSPAKGAAPGAAPAAIPAQVCASYKIVRPILLLVLSIPFMKQSWKDAIRVFMKFMDALCGS